MAGFVDDQILEELDQHPVAAEKIDVALDRVGIAAAGLVVEHRGITLGAAVGAGREGGVEG